MTHPGALQPPTETPPPVRPRVLLVIHNPRLRSAGGRTLSQALGWNDPDALVKDFQADVHECSFGYVNFDVVERYEVDAFPAKVDGFAYTEEDYLRCWRVRRGFHHPDGVDYFRVLDGFEVFSKVSDGLIDEVWLMGFPYAGYYESIMAGPGAFWCNAPSLAGTEGCRRRFVVMGFNYERGVGEMLESFGHRAESVLSRVFSRLSGEANLWERFTRYDKALPGRAEVGNVHFAPNSERDYDWGNPRYVPSRCDDWYLFPDFQGLQRPVNCQEWGDGDVRLHHRWWLRHFPHGEGASNGVSHNWWEYVIDPNRFNL